MHGALFDGSFMAEAGTIQKRKKKSFLSAGKKYFVYGKQEEVSVRLRKKRISFPHQQIM